MDWPRHPTPATVHAGPPSIVKWRKPPRRIVDPSPAPWGNPVPVTVAIGRPIDCHMMRIPNVSIVAFVHPITVVVQITITNDLGSHIARRYGTVVTGTPFIGPFLE